jgi:hypothetical protein
LSGVSEHSDTSWLGAAAAIVISVVGWIATYVRGAARADVQIDGLRKRADDHDEAIDSTIRMSGESMQAIRQKVTDTEIWNRDNFVRRSDFAQAMEASNRNIDGLRALVESSTRDLRGEIVHMRETIEARLDKLK